MPSDAVDAAASGGEPGRHGSSGAPDRHLVRVRLFVDPGCAQPTLSATPADANAVDEVRHWRLWPSGDGVWDALAVLPARFVYRFLLLDAGSGRVVASEPAVLRQADLSRADAGADDIPRLDNAWQATLVRFVAYHPLPDGHQLAVTGEHPAVGAWHTPRPMTPGRHRTLPTGVRGVCWETLVAFTDPVDELAYRYVVLASRPRWERPPDRRLRVPRVNEVVNGLVETFDHNVVAGLGFDQVTAGLWVGPFPLTPEDVDMLADAGISAVLNLQTDEDLASREVDLDELGQQLQRRGMVLHRVAIADFDEEELIRQLPAAVTRLDQLLSAGHDTYVHCTAGVGRAPAVILAHLVRRGRELDDAWQLLRTRHPVSAPNLRAVARALEDGRAAGDQA